MDFTYSQQIIIVSLAIIVPIGFLLLLMKLRIIPSAFATIGGAILIFLNNYFDDIVAKKYGFIKSAMVIGNYIGMLVLAISLFVMYREYKKWEMKNQNKNSKHE